MLFSPAIQVRPVVAMAEKTEKVAGVMGGMGPDATVDFMARVCALTDSGRDQDHVHMIVDQDPSVPNRSQAIRDDSTGVTEALGVMAKRLEDSGADFLVLVCNTAHVFLDEVHANTSIPFIHLIDESVKEIDRLRPDAKTVGVMATDGCLVTNIYQDAIKASGREVLEPEGDELAELMRLITEIKAGNQGEDIAAGIQALANALVDKGAEVIIAGCTEIPIVFKGDNFAVPVVASTYVLAQRTLEYAKGLKPLPAKR
jgi:aspartate racemase